ncbi:hypothetical protein AB6735_09840 [Mucilaginibacter sp. RCC_168]|uniref:hypothetical protein n=1 Tax=Mucilaginibacter sp. RCC_168 TaxID=3239221 RepID=UPI0035231FD4
MANIKLNYLYRDGCNYKNHHSIIFANPNDINIAELLDKIYSQLIDGTWFYTEQWNLPDLKQGEFDPEIDPSWHEFESIDYTNEQPTTSQTLEQFLANVTIP